MNTYIATAPDGQIVTKKTKATYAYAVMCRDIETGRWCCSWTSRLDLAQKSADFSREWQKTRFNEVAIVELQTA